MPATVISITAGTSLTPLSSAALFANKFGILLRADPNNSDLVQVAFDGAASTTFPLKPGDAIRIAPEDAADTSGIFVQSGSGALLVAAIVSGAYS